MKSKINYITMISRNSCKLFSIKNSWNQKSISRNSCQWFSINYNFFYIRVHTKIIYNLIFLKFLRIAWRSIKIVQTTFHIFMLIQEKVWYTMCLFMLQNISNCQAFFRTHYFVFYYFAFVLGILTEIPCIIWNTKKTPM